MRTVADALDDEDLRERGVVVDVGLADGSRTPLSRSAAWSPPRSGEPLTAPALGEHTDEVLRELGREPESVRAGGAVGPRP